MERHAVILVVDDDHEVRELGAELLMAEGHIVKQAADGQEALQILINSSRLWLLASSAAGSVRAHPVV